MPELHCRVTTSKYLIFWQCNSMIFKRCWSMIHFVYSSGGFLWISFLAKALSFSIEDSEVLEREVGGLPSKGPGVWHRCPQFLRFIFLGKSDWRRWILIQPSMILQFKFKPSYNQDIKMRSMFLRKEINFLQVLDRNHFRSRSCVLSNFGSLAVTNSTLVLIRETMATQTKECLVSKWFGSVDM